MEVGIAIAVLRRAAPEGTPDFKATAASLKRCPDTNRAFYSSLWKPCPQNFSPYAEAVRRAIWLRIQTGVFLITA
jgi:hypothetical protein